LGKTLILGIGNILMGDEGVGVHVIKHLEGKHLPVKVDLLDGGTGGFHLLEYFQNYKRVILVDATIDGEMPGTIKMLKPKFSKDYPVTLAAHDIGLKDLLDALFLLRQHPEIILFTISISKFNEVTLEISPEIEQAIEKTADLIRDFLKK
jgi:hydrogenase maturation protease